MLFMKNLAIILLLVAIGNFEPCFGRKHGKRKPKKKTPFSYLNDYGYKPAKTGAGRGPSYKEMIQKFQAYAGIPVTGKMDTDTKRMLTKPRCGAKDMIHSDTRRKKRYVTRMTGWNKKSLTYSMFDKRFPNHKISSNQVISTLRGAFGQWSKATGLQFRQLSNNNPNADIKLRFGVGYHRDEYPFDGKGGTIAHAFYPDTASKGDVHFDDDEVWTLNSRSSGDMDFLWTSLHELGHSLGLEHSASPNAIMWPWYPGYTNQPFKLDQDDIAGIQSVYGAPSTPKPKPKQPRSRLCDRLHRGFDAVFYNDASGNMYLFQGSYVWTMDKYRYVSVNPEHIAIKWRGLVPRYGPRRYSIDAAYTNRKGHSIFFRGNKYYSSSDMKTFQGPYPLHKLIKNYRQQRIKPYKIDAAMVWHRNDRTYFFNGDLYWRFNEGTGKIDHGYPRRISRNWKNVDFKVTAVTVWKNMKTFFLNADKIYRLDDVKVQLTRSGRKSQLKYFFKNCRR